jgi:anti-sigma factor RsiW
MHREIRNHLEDVLAGTDRDVHSHLEWCEECRAEVNAMRRQAALLRQLRPRLADLEPRPGFYSRVMERIEASAPVSIWNLFIESPFGRRIAMASLALAVALGAYLVTSERTADDPIIAIQQFQPGAVASTVPGEDGPGRVLQVSQSFADPGAVDQGSNDDILVNLVTYNEQ